MKKKTAPAVEIPKEPFYLKGNASAFLIALAAFLVYLPTLWYGFSPLDERWVIFEQKELMSHLSNLPKLFSSSMMGMYYRPICAASFMFDMVLGDGSPFIFHCTNLALHILCSVLLFRFLRQLHFSKTVALACGIIFALHPMNVHTVAWIPGRNDSLLCLFTFISCIQLLRYFETRKNFHLALHFFAFVLALFTKENAIVLPFVYFLLWYFFRPQKNKSELFLPAASWLVFGLAWFFTRLHFVSYFPHASASTFGTDLLHFCEGLIFYFGKIFLPVEQSVVPSLRDVSLLFFVLPALVVIGLSLRFGFRDKKIALFGLLWFFVFLAIPIWAGVTSKNQDLYEHRMYTSFAGAFIFLSQLKLSLNPLFAKRAFAVLALAFSVKTIWRSAVYKDEVSFLEAATTESPSIALFHDMLGFKYDEQNNYPAALNAFNEAIRLSPQRAEFYNHRGNVYFQTKKYEQALEDFNKTLAAQKDQAVTLVNRSMTNYYLGNNVAAFRDLQDARSYGASGISPEFMRQLYAALQTDTINIYTEKLKQNPGDAEAYNLRGISRMRIGLFKEALADFDQALSLKPESKAFQYNRKFALDQLKGDVRH